MEYIVFDLEWNQCPEGKKRENTRLPFEIIEIGAWKLNEQRKVLDQFHVLIRPQVYKRMHSKTREVIHMDYKNLMGGKPFTQAAEEFLDWCGKDFRFCTWGDQDVMELQRNLRYYYMEDYLPGPIFYYDVQKLFSRNFEDGKSRKSLEYGIDHLKLPKEQCFHRALEDAAYTAAVFGKLDAYYIQNYFSVDVYQNPQKRKEELHLSYPEYDKYISREFLTKEDAMKDREVCSSRCPQCHKPARRKIRWFAANSRHYYSVSLCQEHGYVKGKIRIKKAASHNCYVVKTLKLIGEDEVEQIREKQMNIRQRRKQKRHQEKQQEKAMKKKC